MIVVFNIIVHNIVQTESSAQLDGYNISYKVPQIQHLVLLSGGFNLEKHNNKKYGIDYRL